jgi:hypothetical protein
MAKGKIVLKRSRGVVARVLIWVMGFSLVGVGWTLFGQEQAVAPTFTEGDTWRFKAREWDRISQTGDDLNGVYELRYSRGKIQVFEVTGDQKTERPPPQALLALLGMSKSPRYEQHLKFPLAVGMKWTHTYFGGSTGSRNRSHRNVEIGVMGIEDVVTAAGTFRAFKIEKLDVGSGSRWSTTYFYSPETKSIVKSYFDSSLAGSGGGKTEIELIAILVAR